MLIVENLNCFRFFVPKSLRLTYKLFSTILRLNFKCYNLKIKLNIKCWGIKF